MRFRLNTLLFAMAVIGIVLARVAYLKQQRDFHRYEVQKISSQLVENGLKADRVNELLDGTAAIGPDSFHGGPELMTEAKQHAILAQRYERAMYRPWSIVWDDPTSVPDSVGFVDFSLGALLIGGGAIALAAWQIIPRLRFRRRIDGDTPSATRPTFRFTIRDCLWLTIVVVLAFAWRMECAVARRAESRANKEASRADGAENLRNLFSQRLWEERAKSTSPPVVEP